MTAKTFEYLSAISIARRLLAIDVPMVRMRVRELQSRVARRRQSRREIGVIEVGVSFDHMRIPTIFASN
jgi:hypothetical protein